jgi:uncharacterized membrane protein
MKIIKIILSVIIGLSLVFFATGIVVKETTYKVEVSIDKPIEKVFTEFTKIEKSNNWIPDVKSITSIEEKEGKIGSSYKIIVDNNGEEFTITESVLAYVQNEKLIIFFNAENMLKTNDFSFESFGENSTKIILEASCNSDSYMLSCVFPYFKSVFSNQDKTYLDNFKSYIESK